MADLKTVLSTDAPAPIGPYSQAVQCGTLLFLSGQIPIDPRTGELVAGDVAAETRQVLENLKSVLEAAGSDLSHVVKTTVYLVDLADFAVFNQTYGEYFTKTPPARSTVQVAALPKGVRVEVDAIATLK